LDPELIVLLAMLAAFLLGNFLLKLPVSLSMALGAVTGILFGVLTGAIRPSMIQEQGFVLRHLFEGSFTYLDTMLIIATAMIFMSFVQESGAMAALNSLIVTKFHKAPVVMLILLMFIVMFPSMVTGSSTAAVLSAGAIVAPILIMIGVPREKTGAIIAIGAILGMAAPPVNIPALLIAGGVDMPYIGFELPLFFILVPLAIFTVLFLALKYCRNIQLEAIQDSLDTETGKQYGPRLYIPLVVLVLLLVLCRVFPNALPTLGMPLTFLISAVIAIFTGKRFNVLQTCKQAVRTTIPVLAKLVGVGMFIQILTLTGARGWIVVSCLGLSNLLLFIAVCTVCPAFGAVSSYGAASVLGVPFLLALISMFPTNDQTVMAAALSVIVCMGDLMPPTALAGNYAASLVELKYGKVFRHCVIPMVVGILFAFAILYFAGASWLSFLA